MPAAQKPTFDTVFDVGVAWTPIAPQARLVWTLGAAAFAVPVLLLVMLGLVIAGGFGGFIGGLVVSGAALAMLRSVVVRRHRSWGYALREDELALRRGVLVRRLTIVPIGRMQFIDIQQGPLDRWLGVANLQLHTAAAASDAKVPMLAVADAERLRQELTLRGAGRSGGT